jgi:hypothetical protein
VLQVGGRISLSIEHPDEVEQRVEVCLRSDLTFRRNPTTEIDGRAILGNRDRVSLDDPGDHPNRRAGGADVDLLGEPSRERSSFR